MMCCKQTEQARLNYKTVPKRKKKFIPKALLVALKKDLRLSRLYSDLEICWANFKTLSRIQVAARALKIGFMRKSFMIRASLFWYISLTFTFSVQRYLC